MALPDITITDASSLQCIAGAYNIKLICTLSNYLPELGGAQW